MPMKPNRWRLILSILSLCWAVWGCSNQGESLKPKIISTQLVRTLYLPKFNPEYEKIELSQNSILLLKSDEKDTNKFELKRISFLGESIGSVPLDFCVPCTQKIEIGLFKRIFDDKYFIWIYCGEESHAFFVSANGKMIKKLWSGKLERPYGAIFPNKCGNGVIVSDFCRFQIFENEEMIWEKNEKDYSFPNLSNGNILVRNGSRLKLFNIPEKSSAEFPERPRHFGLSSGVFVFDSQNHEKIFVYRIREKKLKEFQFSRDLEFPTGLLNSVVFFQRNSSKAILFNENGVFEIDLGNRFFGCEIKNGREKNEVILISRQTLFFFRTQDSRAEF